MSVPVVSETRNRYVGPLSGVEAPVVEGNHLYTAMIWNLLFLADSPNDLGELVPPPSDEQVDFRTWCWMAANKALSPKNIEDTCLSSLFAYVMSNPRSMDYIQSEMEEYGFLIFRVWCSMQQVLWVTPVWSSGSSDRNSCQSV
jgi:hypothetical protein